MIHVLFPIVIWLCFVTFQLLALRRFDTINKHLALLSLLTILSFSRAELNTGDFINYRESIEFSEWDLYFAKEFIFWGIASFLKQWLGSFEIAIYVMDAFIVAMLALTLPKRAKCSKERYFIYPFILLLSFPILMGFANVYRQLTGLAFFISALYLYFHYYQHRWKAHLLFIMAAFTHNVFLGLYFIFLIQLQFKSKLIFLTITFAATLAVVLADNFLLPDLSDVIGLYGLESGGDSRAILLTMNFALFLSYKTIVTPHHLSTQLQLKINKIDRFQTQIWGLLASVAVFINFFTESTTERLLTIIFIVSLYLTLSKYSLTGRAHISPVLFNATLFVIAVLPGFVTYSATNLLFP